MRKKTYLWFQNSTKFLHCKFLKFSMGSRSHVLSKGAVKRPLKSSPLYATPDQMSMYPLINYLLYLLQCNFNMCNLVDVCCCIKWLVVVTNTVDCKKNFRLPRDLAIYMSWLFYYLRVSFSRSLFDTQHCTLPLWVESFSNFSCMFLNPNNFFRFEF